LEHRGEGKFIIGRSTFTNASALAGLRRAHFKKTGFWFQSPGQTDYIFVPFTFQSFRSPYGGNYSTVLAPEHIPVNRIDLGDHPMYRLPRLSDPRPPRP
ncbi:MAG TPA: hypothetical protein VJW17_01675, partial [Pyrinomonadaceae bacterium]|nr:hypothetical protein [Pyrinomonadaceae bacterium]